MSKNKQQIQFEADVNNFNSNVKNAEKTITSLNNQLKLNQTQLKGNNENTDLLAKKIELLKEKYKQQSSVVENNKNLLKSLQEEYSKQEETIASLRSKYEAVATSMGKDSEEAKKLQEELELQENRHKTLAKTIETTNNKIIKAQTAQQATDNAIKETNQSLSEQTNKLQKSSQAWIEHGETIKNIGSKIEKVGNKLSIVSGITGGLAVASVKASVDFESAFTGVTKTVDATEEELAELRKGILKLSTQMPASASEISAVAESAGQLGIETENILSFSKAMMDLSNSTNLSSEEAASQLAKFANVTQMSQKDFDRLGSTIVELGNNFATTEADIVEMSTRLSGAGHQVGMTEAQIMGLATALSSVGIEAEMGGSALSKAMVKMQNAVEMSGEKLDNVLKQTGMTLRELELMSKNDSKSFKELSQSIGMTSTEVQQLITAGTNLEDFSAVAGMTAEEFKKAWQEDATSALTAFIQGLGNAEDKGESAIAMLTEMGLTETRLRDSLLRAANSGDLFNRAIETGTKAWEENIALTNEADKRYETTESQMIMLKNEVTKLAIEFGDELAPSLREIVKDAKPMLNNISSAVKKFSELDKETKNTILKLGALVVAVGPAIKIGGAAVKTIGGVVTGVGTFKGAIGVLKGQTEGATQSSKTLASAISAIKSPLGIATVAVTGVTIAYTAYQESIKNATQETREQAEASAEALEKTKQEAEAIRETRKAIDDSRDSKLNELEYCKNLYNELTQIVDENGKVKVGYEARAEVITNQLAESLGVEINLTDGVIDKYKELQSEINNVILKKEAEAILNAGQEKYNKAISEQTTKTQELLETEKEREAAMSAMYQATEKASDKWEKYMSIGIGHPLKRAKAKQEYEEALTDASNLTSKYDDLDKKCESLRDTVDLYSEDIKSYEYNLELFTEGSSESLKKITASISATYEKDGKLIKRSFEERIKEQQYYNNQSKKLMEEAVENGNESEKRKNELAYNSSKVRLKTLAEELKGMTSITNENSEDVVNAWKSLATDSYDIYAEIISQYPEKLRLKIQEMTGVTVEETPYLVSSAEVMIEQVLQALDEQGNFTKEGMNNLKAFLNGMSDENLKSLLQMAGVSDIDRVMQGIREGNLAEDEGRKILTSLQNGLSDGRIINSIFGTARSIASKLSGLLSVTAKINTASLPGHATGLDYVPYDNYVARLHKGERVLTAKENKEYMTNAIENKISNSTRNMVVNFYPQKMTDGELQRAEKFISDKWGLKI
ncbi:MAG: phage tail tape measure protein [Clostridia bacterium]|nr:phage tail tape measure protein [Clostridia bacterium]